MLSKNVVKEADILVTKTKEQEIEKTDAKLRKTYLIKEEMELEVQSLRKQVATLSLDK